MIRIKMTKQLNNKSGVSNRTGNEYSIDSQVGYIFMNPNEPYPRRLEVPIDSPANSYPEGEYTINPESFTISEYGALKMGRLSLTPIKG